MFAAIKFVAAVIKHDVLGRKNLHLVLNLAALHLYSNRARGPTRSGSLQGFLTQLCSEEKKKEKINMKTLKIP